MPCAILVHVGRMVGIMAGDHPLKSCDPWKAKCAQNPKQETGVTVALEMAAF